MVCKLFTVPISEILYEPLYRPENSILPFSSVYLTYTLPSTKDVSSNFTLAKASPL